MPLQFLLALAFDKMKELSKSLEDIEVTDLETAGQALAIIRELDETDKTITMIQIKLEHREWLESQFTPLMDKLLAS